MRKFISVLLALTLLFVCAACGASSAAPSSGTATPTPTPSASAPAAAASTYPDRPIRVVCVYDAGGSDDLVARTAVELLNKYMPNGQTMYVDNVGGASGTIGCTEVFNSTPDGYTISICGNGSLCSQPLLMETVYDGSMVTPIAKVSESAGCLVVAADAPYDDLQGWIEWCKANPGEFTFGCAGKNGIGEVHASFVSSAFDLDIQPIYYSGNAECATQLLGGFVMGATGKDADFYDYIEGGQMKLIYLTSPDGIYGNSDAYIGNHGVDTDYILFHAMWGPPDMPAEVVEILSNVAKEAFATEEAKAAFRNIKVNLSYEDSEWTRENLQLAIDTNRTIFERLGLTMTR